MEPKTLNAGDSVAWAREEAAYPSSAGWVLSYAFRGPGQFDVTASPGSPYQVAIPASVTAQYPAGLYRWACYVTRDEDRQTLGFGETTVVADWQGLAGADVRSHARRMLDLVEVALEKRIPKDQQSYEIDGMRLDRIPIERLEALRVRYAREVRTEQRRGSPFGRVVKTRM